LILGGVVNFVLEPDIVLSEMVRIQERQFVQIPYAEQEMKSTVSYDPSFEIADILSSLAFWKRALPQQLTSVEAGDIPRLYRVFGVDGGGLIPNPELFGDYYEALGWIVAACKMKFSCTAPGLLNPRYLHCTDWQKNLQKCLRTADGAVIALPLQCVRSHTGRSDH